MAGDANSISCEPELAPQISTDFTAGLSLDEASTQKREQTDKWGPTWP